MWSVFVLVLGLAVSARASLADNITVVTLRLSLEEEHTLQVGNNVEYIIHFEPSVSQSVYPSRVRVRTSGGDTAHPLLVTPRQRSGATTWQLPYYSGAALQYELEHTLCPDDTADPTDSDCTDDSASTRRGAFTLHVGSACAKPFSFTVLVTPAVDWYLPGPEGGVLNTVLTQAAPRVHYYRWREGEDSVRLVVQSEDDVCATVAVQGYTCPILQTLTEMERATVRMTVLRSGGTQLAKSRYPRGFFVIVATGDSNEACTGEVGAVEEDWLWEEAVWSDVATSAPSLQEHRVKRLTLHMKASLTQAQYLVGTLVTLALFLMFYVSFGALILAERWPTWYRLVAPKAVLANEGGLSELEGETRRRRRDSTATFDSSDNSDSDDDDDVTNTTGVTPPLASLAASSPAPASPAPASPAPASPAPASPAPASPAPAAPAPASPAPASPAPASPENISPASPIATIQLRDSAITRADVLERDEVANPAPNGTAAADSNITPAPVGTEGEAPRPFGLPARLHVAALSKHRGRVLRARSDRYLYTLYTVAVFYALPVVQFVAAFQLILNVSGSLDLCYYNFLCAHPLGGVSDFNHVFSNLGYLLLGALFMLQVRRRRRRRALVPRHAEYGIPPHYGLLSSLGAGLMVVGLLSSCYHICPNRLNFQFDTAFMYVLCVLSMVKIYQSRHPDINARAHATFGVLAVLIALVVWGVLGGGALFWAVFTVFHVFTFLLMSLRIYYLGQFRLEKESLAETARALRTGAPRPLYTARLVALLLANAVNWAFAIYGLVMQNSNFASHLLFVLLCNTSLYIVFYLTMKVLHGEHVRWYVWLTLAAAAAVWAPALYFFTSGTTEWAVTPAQSRALNHECRVLEFYDSHDLWHALSAVALYLTFTAMLNWDDGLSAVKRTEIAVF